MNKEWADKWVAALRSGDYAQTNGTLYRPEADKPCTIDDCKNHKPTPPGYCCLGVLTDVVRKELAGTVNDIGDWDEGGYFGEARDFEYTPNSVVTITGMTRPNPVLFEDQDEDGNVIEHVSCSMANDDRDLTFAEIADYVEKNYQNM